MPLSLDGSPLSLYDLHALASGAPFSVAKSAQKKVDAARALTLHLAAKKEPVYGVNTGFGLLANTKIPKEKQKELQLNILRSHAAGFGEPLSEKECRLAAILRLNVLLKGNTGTTYDLCLALESMLAKNIIPCIPSRGSVGASGDLAPLAHLALPLIGEGEVYCKGKRMPAPKTKFKLSEKEGLGLINGTQAMLAVGGLALYEALRLIDIASSITALTFEGFSGNIESLNPLIHKARGQKGQITIAKALLDALKHTKLKKRFVQDPYSLRCAPQVHGAALDFLEFAQVIIERETGGATDNPLVFPEEDSILSGGNFHGEPLSFAFDTAALAVCSLANISERRLDLLLNPAMSGLPAFLSPNPGLESGYMATQYLAASLVSENKILAHPASSDSIPGNAGIEDFVSMGMTSALKLKQIVRNVKTVLAIELIASAQAVDLRNGKGTSKTYKEIRKVVPFLDRDRIVSEDIQKSVNLIEAWL